VKVAVSMATYNKDECLENVLYSLKRQEKNFPFDLCIIDDHSDIDPEPLIGKYFPSVIYKRNKERQGFDVVFGRALELISDNTDIVILQSADVVHIEDYLIEDLIDNVDDKIISMPAVKNGDFPTNAYKNFEGEISKLKERWEISPPLFRCSPVYRWYFFLGAIRKIDAEELGLFGKPLCDVVLADALSEKGFKRRWLGHLTGIHSNHKASWWPCQNINSCNLKCKLKDHFFGEKG
jgi:glycosyltransferase involved in cell wall biosynthesis